MSNSKNTIQEVINAYWDERAPVYDRNQRRKARLAADEAAWTRIAAAALPRPPARVMDAGTGSGFFAFILANLGFDVVGCDLSANMIKVARQTSAERTLPEGQCPEFIVSDAMDPDIAIGSLDAITARYVMWTLSDPLGALLSWKRLLVPGGSLAIIDAPWFPAGIKANQTPGFAEAYSTSVSNALPLAESRTIEDTVAMVNQAGFHHVEVIALDEIYHLDRVTGAAPGHHVQLQYLITAKTPESVATKPENHTSAARTAIATVDSNLDHWLNVFTMASDPTRLRILVALHAAPESTVTELARALERSPNTISQALVRLEHAKLATSRPEGRFRRWRVSDEDAHSLLHHLSAPHSNLHPEHHTRL